MFVFVTIRAIDVWGSHEALARERNLRKQVEREYQESKLIFSLTICLDVQHFERYIFLPISYEEADEKIKIIDIMDY